MVDMTKRLKFNRKSSFLGRNGTYSSTGLELYLASNVDSGYVRIEPITSKNEIGRAYIVVPIDSLRDFIDTLITLEEHYDRDIHTI